MRVTCPNCLSEDGIREAIYGLPEYPLGDSKYFVAGCDFFIKFTIFLLGIDTI